MIDTYYDTDMPSAFWDEEEVVHRHSIRKARASDVCCTIIRRLSSVATSRTPSLEECGYLQLLQLLQMKSQKQSIPTFFAVPSVCGRKHGFGEVRYGGCFSNLVFSTSWENDVKSEEGFWYDCNTSEVLAIQYSSYNIVFFHPNGLVKPTFGIVDRDNGERWEGLCFHNEPCGVGRYYNEYNELVYEGLCVNGFWEGYGVLYYPLQNRNGESMVDTNGWWCHGLVLEHAERFTRTEERLRDGVIVGGRLVETSLLVHPLQSLSSLHCFLEELSIASNALQSIDELNLDTCRYLRVLEVGSNACQQCASLLVAHLSQLQSITVGINAFSQHGCVLESLLSEGNDILRQHRRCVFRDLASLTHISIGAGAFSDYSELLLEDMPRLTSLQIGLAASIMRPVAPSCCFFYASSLRVAHMRELESIALGNFTFYHGSSATFSDLPRLQRLTVGSASFSRSLLTNGVLVLSDLPRLSLLLFLEQSLASISAAILSSAFSCRA